LTSASKNIIRYKYMNRMRLLSTIMGVLLTVVFLSSCGAPQVPTTVEEVPPTTVEEVPPTTVEEVPPTTVEEVPPTTVEKVPPTTKAEVPRISVEELKERIDSGESIVIGDTRGQSSFELGHIAGAIIINDDLPLDQEIVLYCA
jgi:PBP1b-binding outer membrane lipoprotein LpoB